MKKWYQIQALAESVAEILIYEQIGKDWWDETGIAAKEFVTDLNKLDVNTIKLRINSNGGDVFQGNAIYNALRAHKATIDVYIDGIAASISSVIAMAGDRIFIPANGLIMIHDPSGSIRGTASDMRKRADALDRVKVGIVAAYKQKTKLEDEQLGTMMTEETWMTAEEAVEQGFADTITDAVHIDANFDQLKKFKNTPERLFANHAAIPKKQPSGGTDMADNNNKKELTLEDIRANHPAIAQALIDEGATSEQESIKDKMDMAKDNMTDDIHAMIFDGKSSAGDVAMAIVKSGGVKPAKPEPISIAQSAANDIAADAAEIHLVDTTTDDGEADEAEMTAFLGNIKIGAERHQ